MYLDLAYTTMVTRYPPTLSEFLGLESGLGHKTSDCVPRAAWAAKPFLLLGLAAHAGLVMQPLVLCPWRWLRNPQKLRAVGYR